MGGVFSKSGVANMTNAPESDTRPPKRLGGVEAEFGKYDVFISHRGPDTKTGFVGFLYDALKRNGLQPFLDCKSISKGQDSWECIDLAIQTTPLALVIFSESFAQSEWCLRELHAILRCPSMKVLPIFYNVQPLDVKNPEEGKLAMGFKKLTERHDKNLIEEWRADLEQASKLNGWEHKVADGSLEVDLVGEVVGKIYELAKKPLSLDVGDYIVGVKQVAQNLIQIVDEKKVLMLGLWGMGGIGKSTLAKELYNQIGGRFDGRCYVEDVVEKVKHGDVVSVQNHIMKALCGNETLPPIVNKSEGKVFLLERLPKKPFLVVLDDVCDGDLMDYLVPPKMLKEGSICIVTSRNRAIFEKSTSFHEVHIHEVQTLSERDSQIVFACHAFGGDEKVPPRFETLLRDVSVACGGVPLVLKVCGSLLRNKENVEIWKEVLRKLECGTIQDDEEKIFKCLRISYDALPCQYQEMFLDIACALLGQSVEFAKLVWRSLEWSATLGVESLVERALIRVDEFGAFAMHDHLRDMGQAIAWEERSSLGICKRLWGSESLALLNNNEWSNSLQTLILPCQHGIQVDLSLMKGLRILICKDGLISMPSFPRNLRWLSNSETTYTPLNHVPEALESNELVILSWIDGSMERLPASFGNLSKLEVLRLSGCFSLGDLPDSFGGLRNLKNLDLHRSGVQTLPESFGTLSSLEVLDLGGCNHLVELPHSFGGLKNLKNLDLRDSGIQSLPESFGTLSNLEVLNLGHCDQFAELPHSFGGLKNLKKLDLYRSGIQSLPDFFGTLSNLEVLDLGRCHKLVELPHSFGGLKNLKKLDLQVCQTQSLPESFGTLSNLEVLDLGGCRQLVELPHSFGGLKNLKNLYLQVSVIQSLPNSFGTLSNLEVLDLSNCYQLVELPHSFGGLKNLKELHLRESGIQSLPDSFGTLSNLEVLHLQSCYQLMELPHSFGGLKNLKNLDLYRSGIQSLPDSFGTLNNLEVLNLGDCHRLAQLPHSFGGLKNLKKLHLYRSGIQTLPESFGTLSNLQVL